jgi:hypothetical protein
MTDKNTFKELREIDVSPFVEKKNNFNYLSWAWALEQMYLYDPDAHFTFPEREVFPDNTVMVHCNVTIKGKTKSGWLPAMDYSNKAIKNPDARKISDTKMRCLVKTIALHGLGLGLYAGEDIPEKEEKSSKIQPDPNLKSDYPNQLFDTFFDMKNWALDFKAAIEGCETSDALQHLWTKEHNRLCFKALDEYHKNLVTKAKDEQKIKLGGAQ